MNPVVIVLPVLLLLMFGLGLSFKPADFSALAKQPKAVLAGLFAQIVLLPLLAFGVSALFGLEPYLMVGLVLVACSPGGSSSNIFTAVAKGDVPLSVLLTVLSSVITVFTVPPLLLYALDAAGLGGRAVQLPAGRLLVQNVLLVLLPVLLGMWVRHMRPDWARRLQKVLDKAAFPALLLLAAVFFAANRQLITENFPLLVWPVTVLVVAAAGLGGLLSAVLGLPEKQRRTVVIEVGIQNAAQAMAVAGSPFVLDNAAFALPAVVYALMMNVVLLAYIAWCRLRRQ